MTNDAEDNTNDSTPLISNDNDSSSPDNITVNNEKLSGLISQFLISGAISTYAIYVGLKYANDPDKQCQQDAMWLLIFGISSWSVMLLQWLSGYLIIKKVNSGEAEVSRFTALVTGVTGALTTFTMVWAIYGLVVFFNLPACPQGEAHNFGKILAVAGIVVFSLVVCCLICCLSLVSSDEGMKKAMTSYFITAAAQQRKEEAEETAKQSANAGNSV